MNNLSMVGGTSMRKLEIGVLVSLVEQPEVELRKVTQMGLCNCQLSSWDPDIWTDSTGKKLVTAGHELDINITTLWTGYPGPCIWNLLDGPSTIGLVPPEYRKMRVDVLKKAASFAAKFNIPSITTHLGFIPEDPKDPKFPGTLEAVQQVAEGCTKAGVGFNFETGQETPITLLRLIEQVGTNNLGINLDPANLVMYGKANPLDALEVFGKYIRGVHVKDGMYPTIGTELGKEVALGQGKVDFPALISKLKSLGYAGTLTIEREISGEQQIIDIKQAIKLLEPLC